MNTKILFNVFLIWLINGLYWPASGKIKTSPLEGLVGGVAMVWGCDGYVIYLFYDQ